MDIYGVSNTLIQTLTKQQLIETTSKTFNSQRTNADKVRFVGQLLVKYAFLPKTNPRQAKNNSRSKALRQSGNKMFEKGKTFEALELYNQSICWADSTSNSEEMAISYANRSAVYYELKMYEMCCENIDLAKEAGYPKRLMEKLTKRESDCLDHINNKVNAGIENAKIEYVPELHCKANPRIPFIADCLELKESETQGRYVVTNTELTPGQVIAIEEPFAAVLQSISRYHRCTNCLTENSLSLIPCPSCTNAMFCSQSCLTRANKEYHQFECPVSDYFLMLFNKIHMSALRVTLKALSDFESIHDLIEFCRENGNANVTTFSFDHKNGLSPREYYQQIHCLATNEDKRILSDLFQRATIAAALYRKLMEHTHLADILTSDDGKNAFIEILFRHLQTAPTNFHTLGLAETPKMEGIDYGNGAYPFCSLLNHSCAPNICRMSIGRKMVVFALRIVKQGEQLFDNYGHHHCLSSKKSRQRALSFQYNFTCECDACRFDYTTVMELPIKANVPDIHSPDDIAKLTDLDAQFAAENIQRFCQYLKQFDDEYPCRQICEAQENLKMCYHILSENYSFKAKTENFSI